MPPSAGLLHLTGFIKSRWWAANPDSRGCDGRHYSCQNWLRYQGSCLGKVWLGCGIRRRGVGGGQSTVWGKQYPRLSNVSIMGCECSDGAGNRGRREKRGSGGWDEEEGEMRNEEWCTITEMTTRQMGLHLGVYPGKWLLMWCQKLRKGQEAR